MIPIWLGKMVAKGIIKGIKHKIDLKKIDKYVNDENELDVKVKDLSNNLAILTKILELNNSKIEKYGKIIEELEKDVAILKTNSHPPIFTMKDKEKLIKRIKYLERKIR